MMKNIICIALFILGNTLHIMAQTDTLTVKSRGGADRRTTRVDTLMPDIAKTVVDTTSRLDSTTIDSLAISVKRNVFVQFFKKDYPNPRKALILSLILPGSGQAYNRKWWKIPIVYGALGGVGYWEITQIKEYKVLKSSYKALVDDDPATIPDARWIKYDKVTLKANRDISRKNLERSSLILGLMYLLAVTDAFVDAHMYSFDVSEDLSLQFCPKMQSIVGIGTGFGIGMQMAF
jgi:hypothetical protein